MCALVVPVGDVFGGDVVGALAFVLPLYPLFVVVVVVAMESLPVAASVLVVLLVW